MNSTHTSLLQRVKVLLMKISPLHLISAIMYRLTRTQSSYLHWFIRAYIRLFKVNMTVAKRSNPKDYQTFNEFFTRDIKAELRPIDQDIQAMISPCDGTILQFGDIEDGTLLQAKGHTYTLLDLFGNNNDVQAFHTGKYMTIYLAPHDYHCVHAPASGQLKTLIYNPGRLMTVAPYALNLVPNLYACNERVLMTFETKLGTIAVVMVGAVNVGSVSVEKIGLIMPRRHASQSQHYGTTVAPIAYDKGEKLAQFNMGSTVILLAAKTHLQWANHLSLHQQLKMGQGIASAHSL